jgi:5-phospho-D-xylono-1,4-lactonase
MSGGAVVEMPTVHGAPLRPGDALLLDGHAHAWIDPAPGVAGGATIALRDEARQRAGLADFARAALWGDAAPRRAALLDCQPPGAGRDARALARLADATGVAIAACTGFHLAAYYPDGRRPWAGADEAAAAFRTELEVGLAELPERRAAVVKAAHTGRLGDDAPCWDAALAARHATGALLLMHTERGAGVEELLAWLLARGAPADRLYLCHVDKRPDVGLHLELARAGVLLGYDTFLRPAYDPDRTTWPLVRALLEANLAHALALGLDLAPAAMWPAEGRAALAATAGVGPAGATGPAALATLVEPRLRALGAGRDAVDALLGGNLLARAARAPIATTPPDATPPAAHR